MNHKQLLQCPPASLLKQLVAMFYDSFLIVAVLFAATAILLPFNRGEAISGPLFSLYLVLVIFVFYSWFWHKSGQTLGMKVWKIRIINDDGFNPSWPVSFLRLMFATLPPAIFVSLNYFFSFTEETRPTAAVAFFFFLLGYLWRLFKPYTWHGRLSQTQVVDVSALMAAEKSKQ